MGYVMGQRRASRSRCDALVVEYNENISVYIFKTL